MRGKPYVFRDLTAGVRLPFRDIPTNARANWDEAKRPFARDALNFLPTDNNSARRRFGSTVFGTPDATKVASTIYHWQSVGYLVAFTSNDLYTAPITTGTFTSREGTMAVSDAFWSVIEAPTVSGQGPLYATNPDSSGTKQIQMTSPTSNAAAWTAAGGGTLPNGSLMVYHHDRVWMAGVATNQSRLYWSSLGDPTNWSSTAPSDGGAVDLDINTGGAITALQPIGPYLLVFKVNAVYLVYDLNTGANRRISQPLGCGYPTSVVETSEGVFFAGTRPGEDFAGIWVTDGSSFHHISTPIDDVVRWRQGHFPTLSFLPATYYDDKYIFGMYEPYLGAPSVGVTVPASGDPDYRQFVYDLPSASWWPLRIGNELAGSGDIVGVDYWAQIPGGLLAATRFAIYKIFDRTVSADNGTAQAYRWSSAFHTFGNPLVEKRMREIRADVIGSPTMKVLKRYSDSLTTLDETAWETAASAETERRFYTPGFGRAWSLQASGSSSSATDNVELLGYTMMVDPRAD